MFSEHSHRAVDPTRADFHFAGGGCRKRPQQAEGPGRALIDILGEFFPVPFTPFSFVADLEDTDLFAEQVGPLGKVPHLGIGSPSAVRMRIYGNANAIG